MFEPNPIVPKPDRPLRPAPRSLASVEPKQRRMMVIALTLLLVALGFVLYRDRDFWFPDSQEALEPEASPKQSAPATTSTPQPVAARASGPAAAPKHGVSRGAKAQSKSAAPAVPATGPVTTPPVTAVTQRTVLPPLEVEVVAGDVHRTVRPGANSVRVDLQPGSPPQEIPETSTAGAAPDTAASVITNASQHLQMSADASEIVSRPVKPGYPLLARQMKVQGSVILQALISRDGAIQDLHVMSGPPILAGAAREAVRQWRFKPHYLGAETVETQAKITVNFTISTN
jgi:protein TonB